MTETVKTAAPERALKRHRYELRLRRLVVRQARRIAPSMVRLTLAGDDLHDMASLGFDDHVKVFLAQDGAPLRLPQVGPEGLEMPDGQPWPLARDYTVRRVDAAARELDIDLALHGDGPASRWAAGVSVGEEVWIAGPRGSLLISLDFDWHLLIADETGLPAVARRLEDLPAGARAVAILEVNAADEELPLASAAAAQIHWVHRNGARPGTAATLIQGLQAAAFPAGDYHAWVACEAAVAKQIRSFLLAQRGANAKWLRAAGYWRRGDAGTHETFDD